MTAALTQIEHSPSASSAKPEILFLSSEEIPAWSERLRPWLEKVLVLNRNCFTADDVLAIAEKDEGFFLFAAVAPEDGRCIAVMVVEWVTYPRKVCARILMIAGEQMWRWIDHLSVIEKWAEMAGADALTIEGRKGWGRILGDGYKPAYSVWEKEFHNG